MANRNAGLAVVITGDTRSLEKATHRASGSLDKLGKQTSVTARVTSRGFSGIGLAARGAAAATVGLTAGVGFLVKQYEESRKVGAQTNAVLKSTGGAANVTAKHVSELASAISKKTGVDDEAIQSGENLLLTFTNVRNEVGKGNDIFDRATRTVTDMSVALGQDTKSSAIQLGKALNDPIKGVTALQRVGVSFTADQKEQIKTLVDSGKKLDAQRLILGELKKEFAGSAEAQASGFDKLKVSAGNLAESVGGKLAPVLSTAADSLSGFVDNIAEGKGPLGGFLSSIGKIPGKLKDQFDKLKDEKGGVGAAIGAMIVQGVSDIDWRTLGEKVSAGFNKALKIGKSIAANIIDAIGQVPWGTVGDKISSGFNSALTLGDQLAPAIEKGLGDAVSHVNGRQVLGKLVDIVGEAIDALFSPSFWIDHFKAILSVVTLVIPVGKLLKIPGFNTLFRFISKPVFQAIGALGKGMLSLFGKASAEAGIRFLSELETVAPKTASFLLSVVTKGGKALSSLPGRLGGIAADAAVTVAKRLGDGVGGIVGAIAKWGIRSIGRLRAAIPGFAKVAGSIGATIVSGIISGLGNLGHKIREKVIDSVKFAVNIGSSPVDIGKSIGNAIAKGVGIGDGPGRFLGDFGGGDFGGNLKGARPSLGPFAAVGARFGLSVSSGRRPGSITSSGNVSYHSSGEAIDLADGNGPDSQKLAFFNFMKSRFGGRLAELIYTPGGAGIKDGRPHTYTGQVAADHYDHVHVALDTGAPGVGDGIGIRGKVSTFGPPLEKAGTTASGASSAAPGIALYQRSTLGKLFRVRIGGHTATLRQTDIGPAPWTGRKIDVTGAGARKLGISPSQFPTDATGSATLVSRGGGSGGGTGGGGNSSGPNLSGGGSVTGGAGNTVAGIGSTTTGGPNEQLYAPGEGGGGYGQRLATAGLHEAEARSSDNLKGLLKALRSERHIKRRRLRKIRRMLKHHLRAETRKRLTEEATTLVGDIGELNATIKEYAADERVGGATTITQAEQLDAGVDPSAADASDTGDAGGAGAEPAAAPEPDPNIALLAAVIAENNANQQTLIRLSQTQGPQLVAALIAITSGSIGGQIGLGLQTPGFAGSAGAVRY